MRYFILIFFIFFLSVNFSQTIIDNDLQISEESTIVKGNEQIPQYLPLIQNKKIAVVANACSYIKNKHLVDTLKTLGIHISKIFSPEHGFRNDADAGIKVNDTIDTQTGIPIVSLYGKHKEPTAQDLKDIDIILFDLQDVGVRFYTYISTLYYVIKACALYNKMLIVLDRPNPNGFYVDGPVLDTAYRSFVGIIPIPLVYGMTIGELALLMNSEPGFRPTSKPADLKVIPLKNYSHHMMIKMQSIPSPNLNSWQSIILYPSLGLFEGTIVSVGRGTDKPFQIIGHPQYSDKTFCFTPRETSISKHPKYKNILCCGLDLSNDEYLKHHPKRINLQWLIHFYKQLNNKNFFDKNFNYHAGNNTLQKQIKNGWSEEKIRQSWQKDIEKFLKIREKYLLYH